MYGTRSINAYKSYKCTQIFTDMNIIAHKTITNFNYKKHIEVVFHTSEAEMSSMRVLGAVCLSLYAYFL